MVVRVSLYITHTSHRDASKRSQSSRPRAKDASKFREVAKRLPKNSLVWLFSHQAVLLLCTSYKYSLFALLVWPRHECRAHTTARTSTFGASARAQRRGEPSPARHHTSGAAPPRRVFFELAGARATTLARARAVVFPAAAESRFRARTSGGRAAARPPCLPSWSASRRASRTRWRTRP